MKPDYIAAPRGNLRGAVAVIKEGLRTSDGLCAIAFFVILFAFAVLA